MSDHDFFKAPALSAYGDDPEYVAAAEAANDLWERIGGFKKRGDLKRDDRRLLARYAQQMDAARDRAKAAHDAYLAERGLLESE